MVAAENGKEREIQKVRCLLRELEEEKQGRSETRRALMEKLVREKDEEI